MKSVRKLSLNSPYFGESRGAGAGATTTYQYSRTVSKVKEDIVSPPKILKHNIYVSFLLYI